MFPGLAESDSWFIEEHAAVITVRVFGLFARTCVKFHGYGPVKLTVGHMSNIFSFADSVFVSCRVVPTMGPTTNLQLVDV